MKDGMKIAFSSHPAIFIFCDTAEKGSLKF